MDGVTYEHFTDAENTGAPLVPAIDEAERSDRGEFSEHEEAVLSHRIGT